MNLDLFPTEEADLASGYERAFLTWLASAKYGDRRLQRPASIKVYRAMWHALSDWAVTEKLSVDDLTAIDIGRFIDSRGGDELSDRYALRLLTLIDKVLCAHCFRLARDQNRAAQEVLAMRDAVRLANLTSDPLPSYLDPSEAKRLVTFLTKTYPRAGRSGQVLKWQDVRNRAAVALQLGAGLTPGDVRTLLVTGSPSSPVPWKVRVPGNGTSRGRESPVASWAGQLLRHWLTVREQHSIQGVMLFPSTKSGKPWGRCAQVEASKSVLIDAGIDDVDGGSFRLRHTFAIRQLRRGKSTKDVADWLGVSESVVVDRYSRLLPAPVDVS